MSARRDNGVNAGRALLGQNAKPGQDAQSTYHIAATMAKDARRLKSDEAHAELLVRDHFRGQARQPEVSHLPEVQVCSHGDMFNTIAMFTCPRHK